MIHNVESAKQYIQEKKLIELAEVLTNAIAYSKPEDPIAFLIEILTNLKKNHDNGSSVLVCFNNDDIKAMFTVLDPFNKGKISKEQLEGGMRNFGTNPKLIPQIIGENNGPYDLDDLTKYINEGFRLTLFSE